MLKTVPAQLAASFVLLLIGAHPLPAQPAPCPPPAVLIAPDNPAYADAMNLAQKLEAHGFVVNCIFPTKMSSEFLVRENGVERSTIEGEACFRTNYGDIGAFFVPKPQTFGDLKIKEQRRGGGYLYTFSGMPSVWPQKIGRWGSARRDFFLKRDNYLLSASDDTLHAHLEDALQQTSSARSPAP